MPLIVEGVMTTLREDRELNVSPMGPIVAPDWQRFTLRPYQTSRTYSNLKRTGYGVFHVTDNVELIALSAIDQLDGIPDHESASVVDGLVLADCCRWYELEVETMDDSQPRTQIECAVRHCGRRRDFFGFNRAKHAVLEAAILATRLQFLDAVEIQREYQRLEIIVGKTCGDQERRAFDRLQAYTHDPMNAK